jgi:hypothetical protein
MDTVRSERAGRRRAPAKPVVDRHLDLHRDRHRRDRSNGHGHLLRHRHQSTAAHRAGLPKRWKAEGAAQRCGCRKLIRASDLALRLRTRSSCESRLNAFRIAPRTLNTLNSSTPSLSMYPTLPRSQAWLSIGTPQVRGGPGHAERGRQAPPRAAALQHVQDRGQDGPVVAAASTATLMPLRMSRQQPLRQPPQRLRAVLVHLSHGRSTNEPVLQQPQMGHGLSFAFNVWAGMSRSVEGLA